MSEFLLIFAIFLFLRGLFAIFTIVKITEKVRKLCLEDVKAGRDWKWRWRELDKINEFEVFIKFWRTPISFFEDKVFLIEFPFPPGKVRGVTSVGTVEVENWD